MHGLETEGAPMVDALPSQSTICRASRSHAPSRFTSPGQRYSLAQLPTVVQQYEEMVNEAKLPLLRLWMQQE
jgi:hypothetical protein